MVAEQWLIQAIQAGKSYDQLPKKVQSSLSLNEWKQKVKQYCIQHGFNWSDSMAHTSSSEQEYYEDLLDYYKKNEWLFPYHLSHFICRILRVPAFQYYYDLLFNSLKEEKAYDTIPNFTAADVLRHLGIGRTEYISILDACRAKKFIWRVNRNIAKEKLPSEPVSLVMEAWWKLGVVNISENEFRSLTPEELDFLQTASSGGDTLKIGQVSYDMLRSMYKRGLVYLRIPILADDKFTIPPLEGFISNRNVSSNGSGVDPMETLLYSVFIANSENTTITSLARVLNADISEIKHAMGVAVQLGFADRINEDSSSSFDASPNGENEAEEDVEKDKAMTGSLFPSEGSLKEGQAVAVLVDAETTSFLMMGLLSSGIKRHAVTLFEGGRVAGDEVISHLISELRASAENKQIDGEIRNLMQTASALAEVLECVREASGNRSIELLRRESLQGLSSEAITRVLSHSYKIIVPISPLSGDPLPLNVSEATPLFFGATDSVASLWFQLAFYEQIRNGPVSYIFLRGQRITELPVSMQDQQYALLYPFPHCESPHLVSYPFILHYLNELCRYGPTMLQPLFVNSAEAEELSKFDDMTFVDVPLPIDLEQNNDKVTFVRGHEQRTGREVQISVDSSLSQSMETMGLTHALGYITFSKNITSDLQYSPFRVHLGLPLSPLESCKAVCLLVRKRSLLHSSLSSKILADLTTRKNQVSSVLQRFGNGCNIEVSPMVNFHFDGRQLKRSENLVGTQGMDISALGLFSEFVPPTEF